MPNEEARLLENTAIRRKAGSVKAGNPGAFLSATDVVRLHTG